MVTQLQFSRVADERLYQARLDTYQSNQVAYGVAVKSYNDCLISIQTQETYKTLFGGVSELFDSTADLPALLLPESEIALVYQTSLRSAIDNLIDAQVETKLPPKEPGDCPQVPSQEPILPRR